MRVVVTGATGFVGGRLAHRLVERGDEVVALVRTPRDELTAAGVEQRIVDLADHDAVLDAVAGADAVVHAAAVAGPTLAEARVVNVAATRALLAAAAAASARLVHVSTTSVYDLAAAGDVEVEVDEDGPTVSEGSTASPASSAGSAYAISKAEGDAEVARAVADGLVATVVRPPAVLGAGRTSTWGTRMPALLRDGEAPASPADTTYAWVHVDDLVDAIVAALDADDEVARGAVVHAIGGHTTMGAYREAVARIIGPFAEPAGSPSRPPWRGRYTTDRLPTHLGVTPSRSFEAAMAEIAASWRDGPPDVP